MKWRNCFLFFVLLFVLAACAPEQNQFDNPSFCNNNADCVCGGKDAMTGDCFIGNKYYAEKHVDSSEQCPDFCTGIAGNLETQCVEHVCQNVPRMKACTEEAKLCPDGSAVGRTGPNCEFAPCPEDERVLCAQDVKECPDGSYVSRVPPDCAFEACPMNEEPPTGLSNAHWLCEDGNWKEAPEQCFENHCIRKADCQLMGVDGPCGPYMIGGPTETLHKPPVYYETRCGEPPCSVINAMCVSPEMQPRMTGFDCVEQQCVIRYAE